MLKDSVFNTNLFYWINSSHMQSDIDWAAILNKISENICKKKKSN